MSRILLDTHALIWFATDAPRLSATARDTIVAADVAYISMASCWEMAIKLGRPGFDLGDDVQTFVEHQIEHASLQLLDIRLPHIAQLSRLPPHHRDPFDRMLVAQGIVEQLRVISVDPLLDAYGVTRIW